MQRKWEPLLRLACTLALWVRWAASVCLRPCLHRPPATPWFLLSSQSRGLTSYHCSSSSFPSIDCPVVFNASPACVLPQHQRPLIVASTEDHPHCSATPPIFIYLFNILNTQQEKEYCYLPTYLLTPYLRSKQGFLSEAAFWGRSCRRQDRAPPSQKKSRGRTRNSNGCCSPPPPLLGQNRCFPSHRQTRRASTTPLRPPPPPLPLVPNRSSVARQTPSSRTCTLPLPLPLHPQRFPSSIERVATASPREATKTIEHHGATRLRATAACAPDDAVLPARGDRRKPKPWPSFSSPRRTRTERSRAGMGLRPRAAPRSRARPHVSEKKRVRGRRRPAV